MCGLSEIHVQPQRSGQVQRGHGSALPNVLRLLLQAVHRGRGAEGVSKRQLQGHAVSTSSAAVRGVPR